MSLKKDYVYGWIDFDEFYGEAYTKADEAGKKNIIYNDMHRQDLLKLKMANMGELDKEEVCKENKDNKNWILLLLFLVPIIWFIISNYLS